MENEGFSEILFQKDGPMHERVWCAIVIILQCGLSDPKCLLT